MKVNLRLAAVALLLALLGTATVAPAQTVLNTLTNSVAITDTTTQVFTVSSTANVLADYKLFVPLTGEIMCVRSIPTSGTVNVRRACTGSSLPQPFAVTTTIVIIPSTQDGQAALSDVDMGGACTRGQGYARVSPVINQRNAWMWVCIGSVWRGGIFKNETLNTLVPFTP